MRGNCSGAGGELGGGMEHSPQVSNAGQTLPDFTCMPAASPSWARRGGQGTCCSKARAQGITSVFQRDAWEGRTVPLGNRSRTALELPYQLSSSSCTQVSLLSLSYVPQIQSSLSGFCRWGEPCLTPCTPSRCLLMHSGLSSSGSELVPQTSPSWMQPGKGRRRDTGMVKLCCQIPESRWIMEQKVTVVSACLARGLARGCVLCASTLLPAVNPWPWPALVGSSVCFSV